MTRHAWFVLLMLVAPSWRALAQEPLTLDQAIGATVANNATLRAARASRTEADARVGDARFGFFQRLTLSEAWQRSNQPVFVFSSLLAARQFGAGNFAIDALNNPDPIGFFHGAVRLDQPHVLPDASPSCGDRCGSARGLRGWYAESPSIRARCRRLQRRIRARGGSGWLHR